MGTTHAFDLLISFRRTQTVPGLYFPDIAETRRDLVNPWAYCFYQLDVCKFLLTKTPRVSDSIHEAYILSATIREYCGMLWGLVQIAVRFWSYHQIVWPYVNGALIRLEQVTTVGKHPMATCSIPCTTGQLRWISELLRLSELRLYH